MEGIKLSGVSLFLGVMRWKVCDFRGWVCIFF